MDLIYEINTRLWIKQLSFKYGSKITLGNIPEPELSFLRSFGADALWLMGVWRMSLQGRRIAQSHEGLLGEFKALLPDLSREDITSSPYCISSYDINPELGDEKDILSLRARLNKQGVRLILDFVPNHLAVDHPWVELFPEYFIFGSIEDERRDPETFFSPREGVVLAHGKDPYFSAWTDTVQINYFNPLAREAMRNELLRISGLCDGVRCDMAMLVLNNIHIQTWGERVLGGGKFSLPADEFWPKAVQAVKKERRDFTFIAEVYWGLDVQLVQQGFDYVYDKWLYDSLRHSDIDGILANLKDDGQMSSRRLRFIENHDEERAVSAFGRQRSMAAFLIMFCSRGAHLLHQGQVEGFKKRVPVQLIRSPKDETDHDVVAFYRSIFGLFKDIRRSSGEWMFLDTRSAWDGNISFRNIFVFSRKGYLCVVNYSADRSQCYVDPFSRDIPSGKVVFKDTLGPAEYHRLSVDLANKGMYFDLPGYGMHIFKVSVE